MSRTEAARVAPPPEPPAGGLYAKLLAGRPAHEPIPLVHLPGLLPRASDGRKINYSTVWKWSRRGIRGLRLETVLLAGS
ncbi:MAG TPA: hypothetical protein VMW52_06730, partial [Phycisphaerae bacterium]|nr:hypothetical protein [Phycisphaerae bacterium]